MIPDQTVGQEGKGGRSGKSKPTVPVDAYAATAVGMVDESELAYIGMGFFQRWEFANFGTKGLLFSRDFANDGKKT